MRSRPAGLTIVLAAALSLSLIGGGAANEPAIDVGKLEARIVEARRQVTSGEFRLTVKSDDPRAGRLSYHIWFDGPANLRQDRQFDEELQVCIFTEKTAIYYGGRPGAYDNPNLLKRFAVWMVPAAEAHRDALPFLICDPRVAMMVPLDVRLWPRYRPDSLVGAAGRANLSARASMWNGLASDIVSYDDPRTGNTYEYEVVPDRSCNIVRWRMAGTYPGRRAPIPFESTLDCDLVEAKDGLWLPHHIRRIAKRNGAAKLDEMTTIEPLGVNAPVDPDCFTLAGSRLPAKQLIIQSLPPGTEPRPAAAGATTAPSAKHAIRGILWWDGKEIRPLTPADEAERVERQSASQPRAE
ncbi:MAG TPA: hypothetical protein VGI81_02010 [Tepidisphaeraceae bacterium]|jgi:hypothetical protein